MEKNIVIYNEMRADTLDVAPAVPTKKSLYYRPCEKLRNPN